MEHLVDGDVASNDGGWQWTASTGTDPQPYFRSSTRCCRAAAPTPTGPGSAPGSRSSGTSRRATSTSPGRCRTRCRPGGLPHRDDYPAPIVDHAMARERALAAFASVRG
jgi:deoxyribodipyrimidine photo-lyase